MTTETLPTNDAATTTESADPSVTENQTATAADAGTQAPPPAADEKPQGAPESYDFAAPEGKEYSAEMLESFSAAAKDIDLPQEKAQAMLDKLAPAIEARQVKAMETARQEWADASRADPEFGGANLDANLAVCEKVISTYGTPELREVLEKSGLGNHPEIIRVLYNVGKKLSWDTFVAGGSGTPASRDARSFYAKSNMNP